MKTSRANLKKGILIDDRFELTHPISDFGAFRARDENGAAVRIEIIAAADVPKCAVVEEHPVFERRLAAVTHPTLGQIIEAGRIELEDAEYFFSVYRLVGSESVQARIERDGTIAPFKATSIICDLLDGIEELHNCGEPLVHNGINAQSVFLDYSMGAEKPIIFGFENLRSIHDTRDSIIRSRLSAFHAAPELAEGIFMPVSDVYSAGTLLYHMIWGIPSWFNPKIDGMTIAVALNCIRSSRSRLIAPPLNNTELPPEIFSAIRNAINPDPSERFPSAREFSKALRLEFDAPFKNRAYTLPASKNFEPEYGGVGFNAIAGMEELKAKLHDEVIRPIRERDRFKQFGIPLINGILLYGPPGCGKTFIAERLAEEIGFSFMLVKPSDLGSPYVHGGQLKIGELFKAAEDQAPCMVFVDEIDAVLPSREMSDLNHSYAAEVNEFLAQFSNCGERGVFILAATNKPEKMDVAALRSGRIDKLVHIPPPDRASREAIFRIHLSSRPVAAGIDFEMLAKKTEKYVSADLFKIVVEAARKAEKSDSRITHQYLLEAIVENPPSVPQFELERYDEIISEWENQRTEPHRRTSIGFVQPKNSDK